MPAKPDRLVENGSSNLDVDHPAHYRLKNSLLCGAVTAVIGAARPEATLGDSQAEVTGRSHGQKSRAKIKGSAK